MKSDTMSEWESRARQIITALVQRLESHGPEVCKPMCRLDLRDRKAIDEAVDFLETSP